MNKKISIFSFFSGIGILDLAFENNNYDIVFVNEYDKDFLDAYKYARKTINIKSPKYGYHNNSIETYTQLTEMHLLNDMIEKERKKGRLVGFIGGPPCPDFSIAGKNAGVNGENGRLTKIYFDIICEFKPDFFLFENVKGLIKTEKHRIFLNNMIDKIKANGYNVFENIVNALSYGVPQSRERVFLVGMNNKYFANKKENFFFDWYKYSVFNASDVLKLNWPTEQPFLADSDRPFLSSETPKELTVEYWFQKNDVNNHQNSKDVFKVKKGYSKISSIPEGDTSRKSFKRLHRWRFSPTAAYGNNEVHLHPYKERRLSVAEAMAIQSLPKEFVVLPTLSLSKKFKTIGNGVPYLMAYSIAKTLKDYLNTI